MRTWRTPLVILAFGVAVVLISFGIRASFGLFLRPMSDELGYGREVFAFAMAVQNIMWGLAQPFAGAVADRFGSGRVVAACAALYMVGLYVMSGASTPLELTLSGGVLIGLALSGTSFPVILAVIGRSVPASKRSLFLGIGTAGGSCGQLLVVPVAQELLTGYGSSRTLLLLAVTCFVMVPLAAALVGRPSPGAGAGVAHQSLTQAIREASMHGGFWFLTAGFFVCGFHVSFIGTHLPAYVADAGIDPSLGAAALALIGFGNIIGSLGCGALGGRYSKKYLLSALYLARAMLMACFVLIPLSAASLLVFAFVMGLLWLGTVPLTSGLVAQIFGMRHMAMLFGFVFFGHQVGGFLGVWYGGYAYDRSGSYDAVWWASVALGVISAALHWPIVERPVARLAGATRSA